MATNLIRKLALCFMLSTALSLGTSPVLARGAHFGGAGGHFGGGHFGGGSHFGGGARLGNVHSGRIHGFGSALRRGAHIDRLGAAHIRGTQSHTNGRTGISHNLSHATLGTAAGALAAHGAWNHWGNPYWQAGWNGGWGGWVGPVFWPYFYGDLVAFVFWPFGYYYYDPFWDYGDIFVWDAIFWPGPFYGPYYAYAPGYYDIYGGYAYSDPARVRAARKVENEITSSAPNGDFLAQTCSGLAPGITDLPIERIQKALHLTEDQLNALDALKTASSQASETLKTSCSNEIPLTPVGRLDQVQKRVDVMIDALAIIRTPLDNFFNSLNEEQRHRFAELGPSARTIHHKYAGGNLATLCNPRTESFAQLPVQRIEQVIKPTQEQQNVFDNLKAASTKAANQLQASCPIGMPQSPLDRFDAVTKRLDAMADAIKTLHPALADFYASLTDEQKARFNILGPLHNTASNRG